MALYSLYIGSIYHHLETYTWLMHKSTYIQRYILINGIHNKTKSLPPYKYYLKVGPLRVGLLRTSKLMTLLRTPKMMMIGATTL